MVDERPFSNGYTAEAVKRARDAGEVLVLACPVQFQLHGSTEVMVLQTGTQVSVGAVSAALEEGKENPYLFNVFAGLNRNGNDELWFATHVPSSSLRTKVLRKSSDK